MIELVNIKKEYGKKSNIHQVLRNINLKIEKGELIGIMGRSGSGKTTLLNIIGCMDEITEGLYIYNGKKVNEFSKSKLEKFKKENISFVFQDFALMNDYTVYENVELPLIIKRLSKKKRKTIIMEQLKELEIEHLAYKYPNQISGGEKQRCAIARALVTNNELILADEPTGALDEKTGEKIMDILININKIGKTVVIVNHDKEIAKKCNRVIYLKDGVVNNEG